MSELILVVEDDKNISDLLEIYLKMRAMMLLLLVQQKKLWKVM